MKKDVKSNEYKTGGRSATYVLVICTLLYMFNFADRSVLTAVMEPMKVDLGLTDTQAGAIQTVLLLCIAFFSLPLAFLVDRWSRRKAIAFMAILWSAATFFTGLGKNFMTVFVTRAMVGLGEAGFSSGGTAMVSAVYPPESRGKVMGIFNLAVPVGSALGVILGGAIAVKFDSWRMPFFIFAVPGIILGIMAFFMKDYKTMEHLDDAGKKIGFFSAAASLFKIPSLKYMYFGFGMRNVANFALLAWLSAYLMRSRDILADEAGRLAGLVFLMAIFGVILGGVLSDRWQKKNPRARMLLPAIGDAIAALALIGSLLLNMQGVGFLLIVFWGMMVMVGTPALNAVSQDVVAPALKGTSWGMAVLCMYLLGGGWGALMVGMLSDNFGGGASGLGNALMIVACFGFVAAILHFLGSRHYPADMDKVKGMALETEK